jgi:hypothetical protein
MDGKETPKTSITIANDPTRIRTMFSLNTSETFLLEPHFKSKAPFRNADLLVS